MSSIKSKSKKTFQNNTLSTLDKSHNKKINEFNAQKKSLPKKKELLEKIEKKLKDLNKKKTSSDYDINDRAALLYKMDDLKREIENIENSVNQIDYYSKAGKHVTSYYKLVGGQQSSDSSKKKTHAGSKIQESSLLSKLNESRQKNLPKKPSTRKIKIKTSISENIMSFFNQKHEAEKKKKKEDSSDSDDDKEIEKKKTKKITKKKSKKAESSDSEDDQPKIEKKKKMKKKNIKQLKYDSDDSSDSESDTDIEEDENIYREEYVTDKKHVIPTDRAKLNDEYHLMVDPKYKSKFNVITNIKTCCGIEMELKISHGMYVCRNLKCQKIIQVLVDSDKPSHKDHTPEPAGYPYKRINHFNEHLAQIQAKETTDIHQSVYNNIQDEMKRRRKRPEDLNYILLRDILKKLSYSRYYEHIPYMIFKINGKNPPIMTREMEDELRRKFRMTLKPFEKYKQTKRKNYLKYSYALYKLCQLLCYDDFLPCCPLFKSKEKLRQQDITWKKICDDLNWKFYPSEL